MQPKAVAFPTDARLLCRAREKLVRLAKNRGVVLRQSYERLGKHALIAHQRYAHAKQVKRANKALKTLRAYLGRVLRDIVRRIRGDVDKQTAFAPMLSLARAVRHQQQRQRGKKIYSLHAPEVECIAKGKAHKPYEFGVKVSIATTLNHSAGGQFVAHAKALPGNPYDGHTLERVIPDIEKQIGGAINRIVADKGYLSAMRSIVATATTRRRTTSSGSTSPASGAASLKRSNATCGVARRSNLSSATRNPTTAWTEIISRVRAVTPSMRCSPPPATISAGCWHG